MGRKMAGEAKLLSERYDAVVEAGEKWPAVPEVVRGNLAYRLRPYQEEALGRWYYYMDVEGARREMPVELLFNMATGSGKTLIMAALMLDLYRRGYRNFVYFVNSTNIIEKTRDNFVNQVSRKYLFAEKIVIDGERVRLKVVESLAECEAGAMNVMFTTIQGLHTDLNTPRENRVSYGDFEGRKVVLIGDEAHHNNSKTLMSKEDLVANRSWETTVERIMAITEEPVLLEFTATIDLDDNNIYRKYHDRIIYRYDLKHFRWDGYSKDVMIYHVDAELETRMLQAVIISQYRKKVALRHGIWLKPVVMFKSRTIAENKQNYEKFGEMIKKLSAEEIRRQRENATGVLAEALEKIGVSEANLVEELKNDFMTERLMLIDGNNITGECQLKLNSLEDEDNEVRAVFAVDMLNEGWDVLNLFDIVRLYDTRDARNNKPGKTTLREAQLIGRGARYFPFATDDSEKKYVRKFDHDENAELRVIEQLYYHSANNPKYIQEIRQALVASGIMEETYVERTLYLKSGFLNSEAYRNGVVYVNRRELATQCGGRRTEELSEGWDWCDQILEVELPTGLAGVMGVFEGVPRTEPLVVREKLETTVAELIPENILRCAMRRKRSFRFCKVQERLLGVKSIAELVAKLGELNLVVNGVEVANGRLTPGQKLYIAERVLEEVEARFERNDERYVGAEEFVPVPIREVFGDGVRRKYWVREMKGDPELGEPQTQAQDAGCRLGVSARKWYAYNENYGTSEEKRLVKLLDGVMTELSEKWAEVYLLKNEGAYTLYDFAEGRAVEPSFVLVAKDKVKDAESWQILIEAKDGHLAEREKWKEDFLLGIANKTSKIVGLPVGNAEVVEELRALLLPHLPSPKDP